MQKGRKLHASVIQSAILHTKDFHILLLLRACFQKVTSLAHKEYFICSLDSPQSTKCPQQFSILPKW